MLLQTVSLLSYSNTNQEFGTNMTVTLEDPYMVCLTQTAEDSLALVEHSNAFLHIKMTHFVPYLLHLKHFREESSMDMWNDYGD